MSNHPVATSMNGKQVYINLMQQPLSAVISRNPHLLALIEEVIAKRSLTKSEVTIENDMGRTIGYAENIATREKDAIFYARQHKSESYTRFVKQRATLPTPFLTLLLEQDEAGNYEVKNVWIGKAFPPAPGHEGANEKSTEYWAEHAVVYNGQALMASTITKDCPY